MGGHCSQKLLLRRGSHSPPGRSRSSDPIRDHNSIAMIRWPAVSASQAFPLFPPAAARLLTPAPASRHRLPLQSVQADWWPVTATHHWRSGPRRTAKMAPSPAAANSEGETAESSRRIHTTIRLSFRPLDILSC
jgi:hypothetical protein